MRKEIALSLSFIVLLPAALLASAPAAAQDKVVRMSEQFVGEPLASYSLVDRTRILKGLMYAADLPAVPAATRKAWTEFVKDNLPGVVGDLVPSKDEETLEAAANVIEISGRCPAPGLDDRLAGWRRLGPRPEVHRTRERHRAARTGARPPPRPARRPGPEIRRNPPRGDDRFFPVREREASFRRRGGADRRWPTDWPARSPGRRSRPFTTGSSTGSS